MGHYAQYSLDVKLSMNIPTNYIQALKYFGDQDSVFSNLDEIKSVFLEWSPYIDKWNWFVNCNSFAIESDSEYKDKRFSLEELSDCYSMELLSQCKWIFTELPSGKLVDAFDKFLEWLKPYILKGNQPAIGYTLGLSPSSDKQYIIYDGVKFTECNSSTYSERDGQYYTVDYENYDDLEEALKAYYELNCELNGRIGFGFDPFGMEIEVYKNHFKTHTIFDLYDYKLSFEDLKKKIVQIIEKECVL